MIALPGPPSSLFRIFMIQLHGFQGLWLQGLLGQTPGLEVGSAMGEWRAGLGGAMSATEIYNPEFRC